MPNGMAASQLRVVVSIQMSGADAIDPFGGLERRKKIHARGHPKDMERVRRRRDLVRRCLVLALCRSPGSWSALQQTQTSRCRDRVVGALRSFDGTGVATHGTLMRHLIAAWQDVAIAALAVTTIVSCLVIWWSERRRRRVDSDPATSPRPRRLKLSSSQTGSVAPRWRACLTLCVADAETRGAPGPAARTSEIRLERSPAAPPPSHGSSCLR